MTTGKESQYNSVDDLKGTTFGISRIGSGSQVMASVLSLQQGWSESEQPKFKG
jgi:ABC-type nitrate/sulfonate/bicarbonate transport system substrate-binding protein